MTSLPLNESVNVVLNGSGDGTASLGPSVPGERWQLSSAAIRTNTASNPAVAVPECRLYIGGAPLDQFLVDGTFTGSLNSSDAVAGLPVGNGQKVFAVWHNGDPGSVATLTVIGTREVGRR